MPNFGEIRSQRAPTIGDRAVNVLINATSAKVGGGLSYLSRQLRGLERATDIDAVVLVSPWNVAGFSSVLERFTLQRVPVANAGTRYLWENLALPAKTAPDVIYCPANFGPLVGTRAPLVLTLQNPNYVSPARYMEHNRSWRRRSKIRLSHTAMTRADRIIAISKSLAAGLLQDRPDLASRIEIVQSGAAEWPADLVSPNHPRPYYLSLANDYPHKQLPMLIEAFAKLSYTVLSGVDLVLVGELRLDTRQLVNTVATGPESRIVALGSIGDRSIVGGYVKDALAIVSPSLAEAFPLTPAEAGMLGTPCLLSDIAPHQEVTEGRAVFFDAEDARSLQRAWKRFHEVPGHRMQWEWSLSWEDHAVRVSNVLRAAAERSNRQS